MPIWEKYLSPESRIWPALALFLVFFAALAAIQFATPDLADNDGFYHIRFAEIMRTDGLKPDFPWLPLTVLNSREFYDHHFLFHVAQIPFTFGDLRLGAKLSAVLFASLAFLSVWWLLRQQNIRFAALWALGLLAVSEAFLYRMSIPRAQSLSLLVLVFGFHWILQGRYKLLLPLAFVYVWMYDAFPLLLFLGGIYTVAAWLIERKLVLQPLIYIGIGTLLGVLVNPYFPDNLVFITRHLLPKLSNATSTSVGSEWYPYTTGQLLENSLLAIVIFFFGVLALGLSGKKMDTRTAASLLVAVFFGLLLFQSRRFIEYFPPFGLIFAAFAWQPIIDAHHATRILSQPSGNKYLPANLNPRFMVSILAVLIILGAGIFFSVQDARTSMRQSKPYTLYAGASAWLAANTNPGERVFQTDWDDFPRLFYYNTHNTYLIGLDPTYMQLYDEKMYDDWVNITQGEVAQPSAAIRDKFDATVVVSDLRHGDFIQRAEEDPGMVEVYRDDESLVYRIVLASE